MKKTRRVVVARAALGAAWAPLVVALACSRTDDPVERYASASSGGSAKGGSGSGVGVAGSSGSATTIGGGGSGSGAAAGNAGTAPTDGGAPEGGAGSDPSPSAPSDYGCGEAPVSTASFTRQALREAAADCALWRYCRFEGAALALDTQVAGYVKTPNIPNLVASRAAFASAMSLWSEVELYQFGPLASSSVSAGKDTQQGKGIRELVYAWPLTTRCRVEEQVALGGYKKGMDGVLISARGLFGLDYLLHYEAGDTSCLATSATGKKWATLSGDDVVAQKRDYAAALSADVLARVRSVRQAWAPDGGNFRPQFVSASGYESEKQAMTILAWSLLYVERELKDWKLGVPAGYTATSPVTLPEAPFSGLASESVRANLRGFRGLYQGCGKEGEGLGVDDWLTEAGHPELAQDIVKAWQKAQEVADAHPAWSAASPAQLDQLYLAVKGLSDLLKNDLFGAGSPIGLDLPDGIASDTD